jgi:excisionase family DNA binding protein
MHLTIREVTAALTISRSTYYALVRSGKLHPIRVSPGRVVIARSEVDAILKPVQA